MDQLCVICQDELQSAIITTVCGHMFHSSCFIQYMMNNNTTSVNCPVCRFPLVVIECPDSVVSVEINHTDVVRRRIQQSVILGCCSFSVVSVIIIGVLAYYDYI
jgi:hypothetical protein